MQTHCEVSNKDTWPHPFGVRTLDVWLYYIAGGWTSQLNPEVVPTDTAVVSSKPSFTEARVTVNSVCTGSEILTIIWGTIINVYKKKITVVSFFFQYLFSFGIHTKRLWNKLTSNKLIYFTSVRTVQVTYFCKHIVIPYDMIFWFDYEYDPLVQFELIMLTSIYSSIPVVNRKTTTRFDPTATILRTTVTNLVVPKNRTRSQT